jgi:hypothetical protein
MHTTGDGVKSEPNWKLDGTTREVSALAVVLS